MFKPNLTARKVEINVIHLCYIQIAFLIKYHPTILVPWGVKTITVHLLDLLVFDVKV